MKTVLSRPRAGFTLIELLTVIAIMMLIMGLALPNFIAMTKERRWTTAVGDIQAMIWRARAIATNVRKDISVEFDIRDSADNGTRMWLEAESSLIESLPELGGLINKVGSDGIRGLFAEFNDSGGDVDYYGSLGNPPWDPLNSSQTRFGDNSRQSEVVRLPTGLTIDASSDKSPNFTNWDDSSLSTASHLCYGYDKRWQDGLLAIRDIRIATNGALVQTREPTICIKMFTGGESRSWTVIRCTGRMRPGL